MGSTCRAITSAVGIGALLVAVAASGQECIEYDPPALHDSTQSCQGDPLYRRSMIVERLQWNGDTYLVNDIGNEIKIFRITHPTAWTAVDTSHFNIEMTTDDDENMKDFSVCDDCRYGVAGFGVEGVVLFDLGTGPAPDVSGFLQYNSSSQVSMAGGGFTYRHGGAQYLMASVRVSSQCTRSGLYRFTGVNLTTNDFVGCVRTAAGLNLDVVDGFYVPSGTGTYLYVIALDSVHIFRVGTSGGDLTHLGTFAAAQSGPRLDVDLETMRAATLDNLGRLSIWDIADPASPVRLWNGVPAGDSGIYQSVAIRGNLVFTGKAGDITSGPKAHLLDISDPASPAVVDDGAWDVSESYNTLTGCVKNQDAAFSGDGSSLFLARYSVTQMFDLSGCTDVAPIAAVGLEPATAFPGDRVVVSTTSSGLITEWAIWVEDGAGQIIAGSPQLQSNAATSITFTVPVDVAEETAYTAHVAVENYQHPYDPGSPGAQLASRSIALDRTPAAAIAIMPE